MKKPEKAAKPQAQESVKKEDQGAVKQKKTPSLLRGFRDVLPDEQKYWEFLREKATQLRRDYGFGRIDLPILEPTDLFVRAVGKQTDIVEKEMFSFVDMGEDRVTLRPEATASIARAYIAHGMVNRPQPVKLFYEGPMFRYDRPQSGRFRQFNQIGFEILGTDDPVADAQLMSIAHYFFKSIGLDVIMQVNSIGTAQTRQEYTVDLVAHYRSRRSEICEDCKRRLQRNPLRVLDCKNETCQAVKADAPQIVDWLDDESKEHFMKVLEFLDEAGVTYTLNPHLVRGLDYYTRTVFEIVLAVESVSDSQSAPLETQGAPSVAQSAPMATQSALGGGGRYDKLVEILGGRDTPACGFAIGLERVVNALKEKNIQVPSESEPKVFFAQLGDAARRKGFMLYEELRRAGIPVAESFGKAALKGQMENANKLAVAYTLILGQKEVMDGTIIVRDMDSGSQELVDVKKIIPFLQKKLAETSALGITIKSNQKDESEPADPDPALTERLDDV